MHMSTQMSIHMSIYTFIHRSLVAARAAPPVHEEAARQVCVCACNESCPTLIVISFAACTDHNITVIRDTAMPAMTYMLQRLIMTYMLQQLIMTYMLQRLIIT